MRLRRGLQRAQSMAIYDDSVSPLPSSVRLQRSPLTTEVWVKFGLSWLALMAGAWLWAVDDRLWPRAMAAASLLFGVLWVRRFLRSRLQERAGERASLELTSRGLALQADGQRTELEWHKVCRIEQDQDALMVCVVRNDGTELRLDPEYGGLGLDDLSQLIHRFLLQSRGCTDPDKS